MLKDDFAQTQKEWTDAQPQLKIQLSLPSLVDPLKRLSQTAMIIFSPGKLPSANDVAQWINALLKGSFVEGVYFASKGFYKVHLSDASHKQRLLEMSPLFFGREMVHVMPWSPNKD